MSALFWLMARGIPQTGRPERFPASHIANPQRRKLVVDGIWESIPEDYVNTSLFAKNGYVDFLGDLGARFIHLKRPIEDNAYSWYKMDGIPGRTPRGLSYHPHPGALENLIDIKGIHGNLTDYQLCLWLCMEVEARAEEAKAKYDVYTTSLYEISRNKDLAVELLEWTKIPYEIAWWTLIEGNRLNKSHDKTPGLRADELSEGRRAEEEEKLNCILGFDK
jgi:hypothetical protein